MPSFASTPPMKRWPSRTGHPGGNFTRQRTSTVPSTITLTPMSNNRAACIVPSASAATDLEPTGDRAPDAFYRGKVVFAPAFGGIEIDDMDPADSLFLEAPGCIHRITGIACCAGKVSLQSLTQRPSRRSMAGTRSIHS